MAESRFILFENWLAGIQMNTKWGQMDSWQSELIPGISRWMLSKPTEGVFGECCTNDTDGDIDLRRLLCVHAGAWVAEIVVKAFLRAGRHCQPGFQKDIQRMISIKWSLSCSSSNEILYLCFRLLRLLDVTLKSCVILYLLLTGDTAAGWPPRHRRRVSQYVRVCLWCVCGWI